MHEEYFRESFQLGARFSTPGEDGILLCLLANDQEMLPGELLEKTGLTTGRIANILKALEKKDLISRLRDGGDKRKVHVRLTEKGWSLREKVREVPQAVGGCIPLPREKAYALYSLLHSLLDRQDAGAEA